MNQTSTIRGHIIEANLQGIVQEKLANRILDRLDQHRPIPSGANPSQSLHGHLLPNHAIGVPSKLRASFSARSTSSSSFFLFRYRAGIHR